MKIREYQTNRHAEAVRLANTKTAIATAIEGKGVTVPDGTLLDGIAPLVEAISAGGGMNFVTGTFTTTDDITSNIVITHDLGVKPQLFFVACSRDTNRAYSGSSPEIMVFAYFMMDNNKTYYPYYLCRYQKVGYSVSEFGKGLVSESGTDTTGLWYRFNIDETTVTLKQSTINSQYGIGASTDFFWIAYGGD